MRTHQLYVLRNLDLTSCFSSQKLLPDNSKSEFIQSPTTAKWLDNVALRDLALHKEYVACVDARGDVYQWGQGGQPSPVLKGQVCCLSTRYLTRNLSFQEHCTTSNNGCKNLRAFKFWQDLCPRSRPDATVRTRLDRTVTIILVENWVDMGRRNHRCFPRGCAED